GGLLLHERLGALGLDGPLAPRRERGHGHHQRGRVREALRRRRRSEGAPPRRRARSRRGRMTAESKRQRTFVLEVDPGRSIAEAHLELASAQEVSLGHVSGFGVLRSATLDLPAADGGRTDAYALEGPFELLALSGRVAAAGAHPSVDLS